MRRLPRSGWHSATVASVRPETAQAARIELDVDGWPGNAAGQHLDVRLTAPDGYSATRSYSIASSGPSTRVVLAVDRVPGGEVSPFLVDELRAGDQVEVNGPLGRFFVWEAPGSDDADDPDVSDASVSSGPAASRPVQLIGGGSGIVPLYAMAHAHAEAGDDTEFRLLYSVRTPDDRFFAPELERLAKIGADRAGGIRIDLIYTRRAPEAHPRAPMRLTRDEVDRLVVPADRTPRIFVCGSTGFAELVASWLLDLGHDARSIRIERFGGT
ncbi:FAD-binding oxidoreductase [Agromyces larvae]|uniref:FAD-binding oxidoreductase n=1 Tax=Agromyces larvae TaxID=2929802 RepID=A0ABY4BUW7_9MICO|nr:FAD-binding oxidoreductase [Agromyces larvae]UOE42979.1 FAD-binding oxidoreductase [Agromyces larvae]